MPLWNANCGFRSSPACWRRRRAFRQCLRSESRQRWLLRRFTILVKVGPHILCAADNDRLGTPLNITASLCDRRMAGTNYYCLPRIRHFVAIFAVSRRYRCALRRATRNNMHESARGLHSRRPSDFRGRIFFSRCYGSRLFQERNYADQKHSIEAVLGDIDGETARRTPAD